MPGWKNGEARDCPSPPSAAGRLTSARHRSTSAPRGAWHCCRTWTDELESIPRWSRGDLLVNLFYELESRGLFRQESCRQLTVVVLVVVTQISKLLEVDLVAEKTADTTKALDELVALSRSVRHKLKCGTKVLVVLRNPFKEGLLGNNVHLLASLLVEELVSVGLLLLLGGVEDSLTAVAVLEDPAGDLKVLEDNQSLDGTELKGLEGILNTVANLAGILANLLEVLSNKLLLLDELDVTEGLGRQLDGLVEAVLTTVRNVNNFDDLGRETVVKHIGGVEVVLEVGRTSKNDTSDVDLVSSDEVLNSQLGNLSDVVVTLLLSQTGETESGLTTTTVLLGKIDGELVDDLTGVSAQGSEESTVTIHDDEAELLVGLEQLGQSLGMELVVT